MGFRYICYGIIYILACSYQSKVSAEDYCLSCAAINSNLSKHGQGVLSQIGKINNTIRLTEPEIAYICNELFNKSSIALKGILEFHKKINKEFVNTFDQIRCTVLKNEDIFTYIIKRKANMLKQLWPVIMYFKKPKERRDVFTRELNRHNDAGKTFLYQLSLYAKNNGIKAVNSDKEIRILKKILTSIFKAKYK